MIPLYRQQCIQIDVTNACTMKCKDCTRFIDKNVPTYYMTVDNFRKAVESVKDAPMNIGIMGGEPGLHPQFDQLCAVLRELIPVERRQLWTNGYTIEHHSEDVSITFFTENIVYNDHKEGSIHQPLSADFVIKDDFVHGLLVGNCWVNWRWSGSIIQTGFGDVKGYFCEVAGARAILTSDHSEGFDIVSGWWDKEPNEFLPQVLKYCKKCSACIPDPAGLHTNHHIIQSSKGWKPYCHRKVITHV